MSMNYTHHCANCGKKSASIYCYVCNRLYSSTGTFKAGYSKSAVLEDRLKYTGWTVTDAGCWEWSGHGDKDGYGTIRFNTARIKAHRAAYMAWVGPIPAGLLIRHRCDNPPCINPEHLLIGTVKDNSDDMITRNRHPRPSGEKHYAAKLTAEQVREIRRIYLPRTVTQQMLADKYGVSSAAIGLILRRKNWRQI